ncbi:MAG: SHOCT domain-containing protein [Solirubrobacteraceae bacterium]
MFGRKRKQQEENTGLAGLGTGGEDPFSSLSMGGHEPFSSPDPAVHVTAQPSPSIVPTLPAQTSSPAPTTAPVPTNAPTQLTQPTPQPPGAGTPVNADPFGMVQAIQAGGLTGNPAAVLGQILSGHGPVGELVAQIKADPQAFRARVIAQAQAAGVSTVMVSPQWSVPSGGGPPQPAHVDVIDELTKAADLHHQGALSDAEFEALKKKLLAE